MKTGTTGGFGASLLATLVQSDDVAMVYALNRKSSTSVYERQKTVLDERGVDGKALLAAPKLVLLESKADEANLGLLPAVYAEVRYFLPVPSAVLADRFR